MAEHRALQADMVGKLKLMKEAIAALPVELQAAAAAPDYTPFPPHRALPGDTPRVDGYYESKMADAEAGATRYYIVRACADARLPPNSGAEFERAWGGRQGKVTMRH